MRTVQAGILAAAIALSAVACASTASVRPDDSGKSGAPTRVAAPAPPAPLAGLTPDQIVVKAVDNLLAATSVRISGNVVSQGENVAFDFTDGIEQSCSGTFAVTPGASSGNAARPAAAAIIEAGGTAYVKYATSYLESLHLTASQFAQWNGKYISVAPSKLAGLAEVCDLPDVVSELNQQDGGFVKAGTATIDGQPALAFKQLDATPADIVYILNYAIPEILRIKELGGQGYYFDFSNLDAPFSVEAPPTSEVVDGSKLGT
jgi:hypothetical protein